MAFMGGPSRWRTMPWMVTLFGILVIPLGLVHIALVISQPVAVGAWCFLCLLAAAIMLPMIPLEVDEVVAMGQFLKKSVKSGRPFWRTFWRGGTVEGGGPDDRSPDIGAAPREVIPGMFWGVSVPWTLALAGVLGAWLMAAPAVLGHGGATADSDRLAGAVVLVVAVISFAEVLRAGRFLNVLLGAWIAASGWILAGGTERWASLAAGLLVAVLSILKGPVREQYGAWDRLVR